MRFGLIELDPETQARRPRPSAQLYSRLIQEMNGHEQTAKHSAQATASVE